MTKRKLADADIESLMKMLAVKDGMIRQEGRNSLVRLGKSSVPSLNRALQTSASEQVRWEAAKALGVIGDPRSIPALVIGLADSNFEIAWLAAVALKQFKKTAWPPLMRALMKAGPSSGSLYQGAHHVLRNQREQGLNDLLNELMKALERGTLSESVTVAAREILNRLKATS